MTFRRLGVVGAGAWGTALAMAARACGADTVLWARRAEQARAMTENRENARYLPGVALDPDILVTSDRDALGTTEAVLLVCPAQHLRELCEALLPHLSATCPLVICSKGIEQGSGLLMTEVLDAIAPDHPQAVLSGPSFAVEVARGLPTAVTLATHDPALGEALVAALGSRSFRIYLGDDPLGAAIGGAIKNVYAIACGIVDGKRMGDNARAALITRGLAEVMRLGRAKGAKAETFMGLSGLGDLTLTCSASQSRNFSLGQALGQGQSLDEILRARHTVAEGVFTAEAACAMATQLGVEAPILDAVNAVLNKGADLDATIGGLLARPFRAEAQ